MTPDQHAVIDGALSSGISRIVAALAVPVAAVVAAVLYWLQDALNVNLQVDPAVATGFVSTIILGAALTAAKWLEGRKEFEKIAMELLAAYEAGSTHVDSGGGGETPVVPPGVRSPERR
jgi:hypothetical protein